MPRTTAARKDENAAYVLLGHAVLKVIEDLPIAPFIDLSEDELHTHLGLKLLNALYQAIPQQCAGSETAQHMLINAELILTNDPILDPAPKPDPVDFIDDDDIPF